MRITFLAGIVLASVVSGGAASALPPARSDKAVLDKTTASNKLLVSTAALAAQLRNPDLVLLHVGDKKEYEAGHIPGALFVKMSDVDAHNGKLVLELPSEAALRKQLEALGIGPHSQVIVYYGSDWVSPSTRIMFTLQAAGLGARTRLLDGGMQKWRREGNPVTDHATGAPTPGELDTLRLQPTIVDAAFVQAHAGQPGYVVLDARAPVYYDGTEEGGDHAHMRRGHVPSARNLPFTSVTNDDLTFKSRAELLALFRDAGVKPGNKVIAYCHIGQQATAVVFAARIAGIDVVLYDGSFQDWSIRDLPVEM